MSRGVPPNGPSSRRGTTSQRHPMRCLWLLVLLTGVLVAMTFVSASAEATSPHNLTAHRQTSADEKDHLPVCNGAYALRHSSEHNATLSATAWALFSLDRTAAMPVVACALAPRRAAHASTTLVALLGPNTDAERSPLVGLHATTSSLEHAAQMAEAVATHCPTSRFARYAQQAATPPHDDEHAALLRRNPNTHHIDHDDHCSTPTTHGGSGNNWWQQVLGAWRFFMADDAAGGDSNEGGGSTVSVVVAKVQAFLSIVTASDMFRRMLVYPYHVAGGGLLRYFMDEVVTVTATNVTIPKTTFVSGGTRALMQAANRALRVHVYPPLAPANGTRLACDLRGLILLEEAYGALTAATGHAGADGHSIPPAATTGLSLVAQHCHVGLRGGDGAASVTPQWLRRALGFDRVVSHAVHSRPTTASGGGDVAVFASECQLTRRFADDSICLSVTGTDVDYGDATSERVRVVVASQLVLDTAWVFMCVALVAVTLLKPVVMARPMLQLLLCTLLGAVIVVAAMLYYTLKDLQQTRIGKVGMFALLSAGGIFMVAEGLIGASIAVLAGQLQSNALVQTSVIGAGLVSAVFSHLVLRSMLPRIVSVVFTGAQSALVLLMWGKNSEASVCACIVVLLWFAHIPRLTVALLWCVLVALGRLLPRAAGALRGSLHRPGEGEPTDDVPTLADNHVAPYRRPMVSGAIRGRNDEERLRAYEQEGSMHTRRALEDLAATVRAQPHKYAARVRDPNGLARFAGVGS